MAKVCVIMSVFNQEKYLNDSIESILNQTFTDFEFIIINDGSTDRSEEIIKSYDDKRIHYIANSGNKGLIYSLNLGIDLALQSNCTYIARMDSDDISFPNRLMKQAKFLDGNNKIGLLGSSVVFFGPNVKKHVKYSPFTNRKIISTFFSFNPFYHPSIMLRRELVKAKRYDYQFPKYEDYGLWIDLIGDTLFYNLQEPLVYYRRHPDNVTATYKDNIIHDKETFARLLNLLSEKLDVKLSLFEINILAIITSPTRAEIDENISVDEIRLTINSILNKTSQADLDQNFLKQMLIERAILYLKTTNRKSDILKLIISLKAFLHAISIAISLATGRKWQP